MSDHLFTGESKHGNIQEALANAIQKAKETLVTDAIKWYLLNLYGSDGGGLLVQNLKLVIYAESGL